MFMTLESVADSGSASKIRDSSVPFSEAEDLASEGNADRGDL